MAARASNLNEREGGRSLAADVALFFDLGIRVSLIIAVKTNLHVAVRLRIKRKDRHKKKKKIYLYIYIFQIFPIFLAFFL